jgi:hypothetical protein
MVDSLLCAVSGRSRDGESSEDFGGKHKRPACVYASCMCLCKRTRPVAMTFEVGGGAAARSPSCMAAGGGRR